MTETHKSMADNLLITGIPRSGTSYLCSILNNVHNTVVINEPEEIFQILRNDSVISLSDYYKNTRNRINNSQPITNKIANGRFIEDTNKVDTRTSYSPIVDTTDFILGTKNTLIYLNTLDRITRSLPNIVLIACVRNPYDTIASWCKVSFQHIRNVTPDFLLEYTTGDEKESISEILQITDIAIRYATWWNHLAKIILRNSSRFLIINYENMVRDPEATLTRIFTAMSLQARMRQTLQPSTPRNHSNVLSDDMILAINTICMDSAKTLGYIL